MYSPAFSKPMRVLNRKRFRNSHTKQRQDDSEDAEWYQQELAGVLTLQSHHRQRPRRLTQSQNHSSKSAVEKAPVMSPSLQLDPGYYRKSVLLEKPLPTLPAKKERPPTLIIGRPPPRSSVPTDLDLIENDDVDSLLDLYSHSPVTPSTSSSTTFTMLTPVPDEYEGEQELDDFPFDVVGLDGDDDDLYQDVDLDGDGGAEEPLSLPLSLPGSTLFEGELFFEGSFIVEELNERMKAEGVVIAKSGPRGSGGKRKKRGWLKKNRKTPIQSSTSLYSISRS
ncbi:hypothetical protein VNI00_010509 [Paramarasmius palmivorus]|uniref:Uncharacterized protein n=1 Tax=Paramarasmius palmivorus TaxID=297713 RepID=A0AAW0CKU8_9AGAR